MLANFHTSGASGLAKSCFTERNLGVLEYQQKS